MLHSTRSGQCGHQQPPSDNQMVGAYYATMATSLWLRDPARGLLVASDRQLFHPSLPLSACRLPHPFRSHILAALQERGSHAISFKKPPLELRHLDDGTQLNSLLRSFLFRSPLSLGRLGRFRRSVCQVVRLPLAACLDFSVSWLCLVASFSAILHLYEYRKRSTYPRLGLKSSKTSHADPMQTIHALKFSASVGGVCLCSTALHHPYLCADISGDCG
jgi:hypothetical protein